MSRDTTQQGADNALDLDKLEADAAFMEWYLKPSDSTGEAPRDGMDFYSAKQGYLAGLARRAAQPVEPIYQRDDNGAWRDTSLIGMQSWKDAGYETRVVYATHPAEPVETAVGGALVAITDEQSEFPHDFRKWDLKREDFVAPPVAAPVSQYDAGASVLTDAQIEHIAKAHGASMVSCFTHPKGPTLSYKFGIGDGGVYAFARAIEAELASRCGAQGRVTQASSAESIPTKGNGDTDKGEGK